VPKEKQRMKKKGKGRKSLLIWRSQLLGIQEVNAKQSEKGLGNRETGKKTGETL